MEWQWSKLRTLVDSHTASCNKAVATGRGTLLPHIARLHWERPDQHIGVSFRRGRLREGGAWGRVEGGRERDSTHWSLKHCPLRQYWGRGTFSLPNYKVRYPRCITIIIFSLIFHLKEENIVDIKASNRSLKEISSCSQAVPFFLFKYILYVSEHKEIIFSIWGKLFITFPQPSVWK